MKVIVDRDSGQDHGQCAIAAPDVLTINDEGHLEYVAEPDPAIADPGPARGGR